MLPVIALVGRPNVGKSTLFNRLTRTRDALVADQPGLTRDRQYGVGRLGDRPYVVVDTGGLSGEKDGIDVLMRDQALSAVEEADVVLFLVDGHAGLTADDAAVAKQLRKSGKTMRAVVNKTDRINPDLAATEFYALGMGEPMPIAAAHGRGVHNLIDTILAELPEDTDETEDEDDETGHMLRVSVVGRPNVGKSTLVNRILGEERVLAFDMPGTTRDTIHIPFERDDQRYMLIDTAGVRRRRSVTEVVEKFSIIKTLQAIEKSNVVLLVLDAHQGLTDQDIYLASHVHDSGRAVVVTVNKWDGLDKEKREIFKEQVEMRLGFMDFAEMYYISALHGTGVGLLLDAVKRADQAAHRDLSTTDLTRVLEDLVVEHLLPLVRGRRIKLRYAHQGGRNPPIIVLHGNQTRYVPDTYKRYLIKRFRTIFKLQGTPVRLEFKSGHNPFEGKPNKLNETQNVSKKRIRNKEATSRKRKARQKAQKPRRR